jgi:nicotinamidase-related amidase
MPGPSDDTDVSLAELLEFALAGRPERLTALMENAMPAEARAALRAIEEATAALALEPGPAAPKAELRDKLMATLRAKKAAARPARKAVLVCDMINDHLTPGRVLEVPRARDIVPALVKRLDEARAAGIPVVYVLDRHSEDHPEHDEWGTHAVEGTEGAEVWPPLAPKPGDRQVTKASYSGFYESELEKVLDELGVDTLVLTGCATEVQLQATATDALMRGYAVEMPPDSQAGATEVAEQVTMGVLAALAPFAPSRKARLARLAAHA